MNPHRKYLLYLGLVCTAVFISHLDVIYVNIMEARNFITAREMLQNGNWVHTTMNLEPRYEKPPLPTWLTAISASVFGLDSLFGLRLHAVLSVIFIIFTAYFFSYRLLRNTKQAFLAALILATSFYIIFSGRNGQWDIFAHAFMLFAIFQFFLAFEAKQVVWKHWVLAGIFLGLSFMSKGPVSHFALLLPFLIAYGFVYNYTGFLSKWKPLLVSILLFLVVGFTWGAYIYLTDSGSADAIADKETAAWSNRNVRPFYYYWSFFTQSGIWTFFAFVALTYPYMKSRVNNLKIYQFSFLWTMVAVVLLSMIPEKKSRYLLPVLIPMALNTSFYIEFLIRKAKEISKTDRWLANFGFGLIALIGIAFPVAGYFFFKDKLDGLLLPFSLVSVALFLTGLFIFRSLKEKNYENSFYAVILFLCSVMVFGFPLAKTFYDNPEFRNPNLVRKIAGAENVPLFYLEEIAPEIIWELGEPAKRISTLKELSELSSAGIFANDSIAGIIENNFEVKSKIRIDLNYVNPSKSGYKTRLTEQFLLIENNSNHN